MKELYVKDIVKIDKGQPVEISGWIASKREHGSMLFLDLVDSTGNVQVVINRDNAVYDHAHGLKPESSVRISGIVKHNETSGEKELEAASIELIGEASLDVSPRPRTEFDIFSPRFADLALKDRHLYLRNRNLM